MATVRIEAKSSSLFPALGNGTMITVTRPSMAEALAVAVAAALPEARLSMAELVRAVRHLVAMKQHQPGAEEATDAAKIAEAALPATGDGTVTVNARPGQPVRGPKIPPNQPGQPSTIRF